MLEAIARIAPQPWTGEVWRHTFGSQPPDRTNTRGARWNPPGVEALYASLERETALAEADHLLSVQPIPPRATRNMHRLRLSLEAMIDLRDPTVLAELGIDPVALATDDYSLCQAIGGAAAFLELDGLIVASARAPGSNVVIMFVGAGRFPGVEVLSSEVL